MEIFVGAALALIGVAIFVVALRRLRPVIERDEAHEHWCASGPVLLALSCTSVEGAERVATALRRTLGRRSTLVNTLGRRPHAQHRMHVTVETAHRTVVRLVARGARRIRAAERQSPETRELLAALALPMVREAIVALWLHGELWDPKRPGLDRARLAWHGRIADDGKLVLEEMIGRAAWVDRGPNDSQRRAA